MKAFLFSNDLYGNPGPVGKPENIHSIVTAIEKSPKHPSYRHGNWKKPKTSILSSRQLKKAQNINPVVTATGKMPKHQSCRHGNRKNAKTSILLSRQPVIYSVATTIPLFRATAWLSKLTKSGFQHSARNRQICWNPLFMGVFALFTCLSLTSRLPSQHAS